MRKFAHLSVTVNHVTKVTDSGQNETLHLCIITDMKLTRFKISKVS